ncbi:hypothetical protein ACFFJB_14500 [Camelimonas abortus]|uniref:Uncharacterized protein n=1 Tax=Camelimonas abortus TaxID=1017184 RepID=A0ABV7LFM1_9HYPH
MNASDPIRIEEFRAARDAGGFSVSEVSRAEARRQFRFSLALVTTLVAATVLAAAVAPYGVATKGPQVARNDGAAVTVVR